MADLEEIPVTSPLHMDRDRNLGNTEDVFGRRALHVKVGNSIQEPIPMALMAAAPAGYNNGTVDYDPTSTIYKFYQDATLLKTITLNFSDTTKETLISWSIV